MMANLYDAVLKLDVDALDRKKTGEELGNVVKLVDKVITQNRVVADAVRR